jgi:hypothetical protein
MDWAALLLALLPAPKSRPPTARIQALLDHSSLGQIDGWEVRNKIENIKRALADGTYHVIT